MIRKILMIGTSLAAMGLWGCNRQDRSPTQVDEKGVTGSARIALPSLPAGYLADSAEIAWFSLSITGPGMAPILKSWTLSPDHSEPVIVQGIPAGSRNFHGRLVRVDPLKGDTTVTHEGSDSAYIQSGAVAEVHLYLKAAGSGSAHVCVDVEGWPADPTCIVPPPPMDVAGCYRIQVTKPGAPASPDTVIQGKLRLIARGDSLEGTVDWGGRTDTSVGILTPDGTLYFQPGKGRFYLKGHPDSLGFWGFFDDSSGIAGSLRADAISCEATVPGDTFLVVPKSTRTCFFVAQTDNNGKTLNGGLAVESRVGHSQSDFFLRMKGFDFIVGQGSYYVYDDPAASLNARLPVPQKMFPSHPAGMADYAASVDSAGTLTGWINAAPPGVGSLGTLKGQSRGCVAGDFPL
jgi:hypothetical protein